MVRRISAKVGQGIFLVFLHLLALGNSSSESFDAGHVRYPVAVFIVAADIQTRQCPDGEMNISKGGTGDGLGILVLTCTQEEQQREL